MAGKHLTLGGALLLSWGCHSAARPNDMPPSAVVRRPSPPAARGFPMRFEPNEGQFSSGVRFEARGPGYGVSLLDDILALGVDGPDEVTQHPARRWVNLRFSGHRPDAEWVGEERLPGVSNYLLGRDHDHWHTGIPNFSVLRCRDLYPGVDLVLRGGEGNLEYDLELAPGADLERVRLSFEGVDELIVAPDGALDIRVGKRSLRQPPPAVAERLPGGQTEMLDGSYVLRGPREVGFRIPKRRSDLPLLIDPVLVYSTYLGGTPGLIGDRAFAVVVDPAGNSYLAGETNSATFPVTDGGFQTTFTGGAGTNAFIAKLDPGGQLIYSTFLGGTDGITSDGPGEAAHGIAVDDAGHAIVVGQTNSQDFPTVPSSFVQPPVAFMSELSVTGDALLFSESFGNGYSTGFNAVAADSNGKVYAAGGIFVGQEPNAFLGEHDFSVSGGGGSSAIVFGGALATAFTVAVDSQHRIIVGGSGSPMSLGVDGGSLIDGGTSDTYWAFVSRFEPDMSSVDYMILVPGAYDTLAVAVDISGAVYLDGYTQATAAYLATTPGAFQVTTPSVGHNGDYREGFVAKLSADGGQWDYVTYLGGSWPSFAWGLAIDPACQSDCNVWLTGTANADFPTVDPVPSWNTTPPVLLMDEPAPGYVAHLDATGSKLLFSSLFFLRPYAIAAASDTNVIVAGGSDGGGGMVTFNPFQASYKGGQSGNAAVARIGLTAPGPALTSVEPAEGSMLGGTAITIKGGYFGSLTVPALGDAGALAVSLVSSSVLMATTPTHASGVVDVMVTNDDGQSAILPGAFTYLVAVDAGQLTDAGIVDAGMGSDAGSQSDAGAADGGQGNAPSGCGCTTEPDFPVLSAFLLAYALLRLANRRPGARSGCRSVLFHRR